MHSTSRLEAFSDGVIAIAITLLVLEVGIPHVGERIALSAALRHEWPSYFAYVVSFVTIGVMWWNHHELFEDMTGADHTLMLLNLMLLMCIAFIPFPTALVGEYIRDRNNETTALVVYGCSYIATAVAFNALWLYAAYGARLLRPDMNPDRIRVRTLRYLPGTPLYAIATGLAFVSPWVSLAMFGAMAALYMLPTPE